ncbi:hypothetical protein SAMN04515620_101289 [Collimonas sp. OK607]|nr:hypothetical protein SAMN04515620_101289 [Collimonas sp. OK607]
MRTKTIRKKSKHKPAVQRKQQKQAQRVQSARDRRPPKAAATRQHSRTEEYAKGGEEHRLSRDRTQRQSTARNQAHPAKQRDSNTPPMSIQKKPGDKQASQSGNRGIESANHDMPCQPHTGTTETKTPSPTTHPAIQPVCPGPHEPAQQREKIHRTNEPARKEGSKQNKTARNKPTTHTERENRTEAARRKKTPPSLRKARDEPPAAVEHGPRTTNAAPPPTQKPKKQSTRQTTQTA